MLDFDVIEAKKDTPKKEAPKPKAKKGKKDAVPEPEPVEEEVEAPKVKATKAKKGKKVQEEPVEEPAEEIVEVDAIITEDGDVEDAAEDDQTAALLAGFSSDESDAEDDEDFDADAAPAPKLTKAQKKAIAKARDTPKATEPGVIYVGYATPLSRKPLSY